MRPNELQKGISFVIFDTELTAWDGSNERGWRGYIPGTSRREHREVIQIAAQEAWLSQNWNLSAGRSYRQLVRPWLNPQLSSYVTQLTNITQSDIDRRGVDLLPSAVESFRSFVCHDDVGMKCVPMLSWGDDFAHFESNARLQGRSLPREVQLLRAQTHDVREIFAAAGINVTGWNSGTIHRHPLIGVQTAGQIHDAGWDTMSIMLALQTLLARHTIPVLAALRKALVRPHESSSHT